MDFHIDLEGMRVELEIKGYKLSNSIDCCDFPWCSVDFSICAANWLNYHKKNDKILCCQEVEYLEKSLTWLLDGQLEKNMTIDFFEPDFTFLLYPSNCFTNVYVEWQVKFWDGSALSANYLTLTLCREDIAALRDYLVNVMCNK